MLKCTICKKEIHEKAVICPGCGCAVAAAAPVGQTPVQNATPRPNANVPLIAIIAVGVVVAIGLYIFVQRENAHNNAIFEEWISEQQGWQPPQMSELPQIQRPQGNSREGQLYDLYVQQMEQWLQQQERMLQHNESQAMLIMESNPFSNPHYVRQVLQHWELTWKQWDDYKAQWEQQKREMERLAPRQRDELVQQMRQRMLQQQYMMQSSMPFTIWDLGGGGGGSVVSGGTSSLCSSCFNSRTCKICLNAIDWANEGRAVIRARCNSCGGSGRCRFCR